MRNWLSMIAFVVLLGGCLNTTTDTDATETGSSGGDAAAAGGGASAGDGAANAGDTATVDRVLDLVNQERQSRGLEPLTANAKLAAAATGHAADMRENGFFSHTGSNGSTVGDRATSAGFVWSLVGENIAQGQPTPEAVMAAWMGSDGHRANILNADYRELGVAADSNGSIIWVQVFATGR